MIQRATFTVYLKYETQVRQSGSKFNVEGEDLHGFGVCTIGVIPKVPHLRGQPVPSY